MVAALIDRTPGQCNNRRVIAREPHGPPTTRSFRLFLDKSGMTFATVKSGLCSYRTVNNSIAREGGRRTRFPKLKDSSFPRPTFSFAS